MKPYISQGAAESSSQLVAEGFTILPPANAITQGMIVLAHVSFPRFVADPRTQEKVVDRRGNIETHESKARPVMVVSKEIDAFGEVMVVPLTTKEYATAVPLLEWEQSNLTARSSASIHSMRSIKVSDVIKLIGYTSEIDKARIMMGIYNLF